MMKYKINENDSYINENTLKELYVILKEADAFYYTYRIERIKVLRDNSLDINKIINSYYEIRSFHLLFQNLFWFKYLKEV